MNNRGQILPVLGVIFGLIVFFILYAMFFAGWLTQVTQDAIVNNGMTGIEAFLLNYIHLWVMIGVMLGTLVFIYVGGGQQ